MRFQTPLVPARLIRRYKRFLADAQLETGEIITAHCANPGSMMGLKDEGLKIWLEPNDDPRKKLNYGWRLVDHENGHFTGVDTSLPNRALKAALLAHQVEELKTYPTVRPEVKYGTNSRVDFLLSADHAPDLYLEVKSVTLMRQAGRAEFPDSVTARGAKHMAELAQMKAEGHRAMLFYLVQRTDSETVSIAGDIDPNYAQSAHLAFDAGVEVLCYDTVISPEGIEVGKRLPFSR